MRRWQVEVAWVGDAKYRRAYPPLLFRWQAIRRARTYMAAFPDVIADARVVRR